jgi:hypothetical protein
MVAGIAGLSLIAGLIINSGSIQDFRKVSRDHREASNRYDTLTSRLSPLLYSGLDDVLHRSKGTLKPSGGLSFTVRVITSGFFRSVGSTFPAGHLVWQRQQKIAEGLEGYVAKEKVAGFAQASRHVNSANRPVFDRFGKQIGEILVARTPTADAKWTYIRPIFERSTTTPWSGRVVGTLILHSSADDADSLFKTEEFHNMVDSVSREVSPYLDAIQVLMGEETS